MLPTRACLLTADEMDRTHQASLEILETVGLAVHNPQAREIFRRHGCPVADEGLRVAIPARLVEEFAPQTPPTFTFRARDPSLDRTIPDEAPLVMTASSAPYLWDPATGERRMATSQDLARIARLVNELPGIDVFSVSVVAEDAPQDQYSLTRFYTAMKNCAKPIRGSGDPGMDTEAILKLAYAVAGSEAAYRDHPFITHHTCPMVSPLTLDHNSTELMLFFVEQGLPHHFTVVPNAGLTSPITLTGTLAQGNAEFLALATLAQMVRPGTPLIYSSLPTVADLRTGAYAPGGTECGMLNMAFAQLAQRYRVPSSGYVGLTNAKRVDAQAGLEKALSCMGGVLAGMDAIQFVGLVDSLLTFDFGMAVIDNEIALMLKRMARGLEFTEDNLALDDIREVGPGGMFALTDRTVAQMRTVAFTSEISDRQPYEDWMAAGGPMATDRARDRAREILEQSHAPLLPPEVEQRIQAVFEGMVSGELTAPSGWQARSGSEGGGSSQP